EDRLRSHSLISQAMVIGDNRRFISALVTIDEEVFDAWWPGEAGDEVKVADVVDHPDLPRQGARGDRRRELVGVACRVDPRLRHPAARFQR
ncbi:MAG: hypothetical protein V9F00_18770, partial [Nocardioides sp.]